MLKKQITYVKDLKVSTHIYFTKNSYIFLTHVKVKKKDILCQVMKYDNLG